VQHARAVALSDQRGVRDAHLVQFYADDEALVDFVAEQLRAALTSGAPALVVAKPEHTEAFFARLDDLGVPAAEAQAAGQLRALDASSLLASFLVDGSPDAELFEQNVGGPVRRALEAAERTWVFGEMVALLWERGQVNAALELERLWNKLGEGARFDLLCSYPSRLLAESESFDEFEEVCNLHSEIVRSNPQGVWSSGLGGASMTFPLAADAPRAARRFVVSTLTGWQMEDIVEDAALVVTELATNAVLHASSGFRVVIAVSPMLARISVVDSSSEEPWRKEASLGRNSGRGLALVSALAERWGTTSGEQSGGKVVWAELRR